MKMRILIMLCIIHGMLHADLLYMKKQSQPMDVQVVRDSWNTIAYTVEGVEMTSTWDRIDRIEYKSMEKSYYEQGIQFMKRQAWNDAVRAFIKEIKRPQKTIWKIPYSTFKAGESLYNLGMQNGDQSAFEKALKFFQKNISVKANHFEPDALIMMGKCYLYLQKYDKAEEILKKVGDAYTTDFKVQARSLLVDVLFKSGDFSKARQGYIALRKLIRDKNNPAGYDLDISIALCEVQQNKQTPALRSIQSVISQIVQAMRRNAIEKATGEKLLARAYYVKGLCFFTQQPKDLNKALRAFLHTALTYEKSGSSVIADATLKAGQCLVDLLNGNSVIDPAIRKQMISKARLLLQKAKGLDTKSKKNSNVVKKYIEKIPST